MALGSCVFVAKALSKDRLFAQSEELLRRGSARGAALPLLVLVNQGAGAKLGAVVAEALSQRSADVAAAGGTMRVVDVANTAPREALRAFASEHAAYRVLVCGGDGTVTWVLAAIEELLAEAGGEGAGSEAADAAVGGGWAEAPYRPAVGILPLGTGNDLARVLGWGKSFRRERMLSQLAKLDRSRIAALDRWQMRGSLPEGRAETRLCNYCSIGVDAKAALLWARLSEARPELFKLRLLNKLWYIICGTPEFALHSFSDLNERVFLECDGEKIPLPPNLEGLMVLNTPSYGGGSDLWDEQRKAPLSSRLRHMHGEAQPIAMDDGLLEVVGVTDVVHLALTLGGLSNGVRICQGRTMRLHAPGGGVPLQVDGEPFNQESSGPAFSTESCEPFDFTLERQDSALMLAAPQSSGPEAGAAELAIERGVASGTVSVAQRDALLRDMAS